MPASPLTHHEILGLVEPFTRRGRHVDLAASDRLERRLAFRPLAHDNATPGDAPLQETLQLDNPADGVFRLQRIVTNAAGLESRLVAEGGTPAELLARIDSVALACQFDRVDGVPVARSHRVEPGDGGVPRLVFLHGAARVEGLHLTLERSSVRGSPATVELLDPQVLRLDLPDDLIAVQGRDWSRLQATNTGWRSSLRLRGRAGDAAAQGADAERKLEQLVRHLARVLAEPPARFHERLAGARWAFALRRTVPLLVCVSLIGASFSVSKLQVAQDSVWRLMILQSPPLLLMLVFCLRELPRIEIPPLPRRSPSPSWRPTPPP